MSETVLFVDDDPGLQRVMMKFLTGAESERVPEIDAVATFRKPVSFPEVITAVRRACR